MAVTGRPREFDRQEALDAAMRVFWRKGYAGASMKDLCEGMSIGSPSLYAAFGSKEELYLDALNHYISTYLPGMWSKLTGAVTAREGIREMLLAGAELLPPMGDVPAGCMATTAAVGDEWPLAIAEAATQFRQRSLESMQSRLQRALDEGELAPGTNISHLGRFYLAVLQGMTLQSKDGAGLSDLTGIVEAAMNAWPERSAANA